MKKTITLLALAFTFGTTSAQTFVADFETYSLTANSNFSSTITTTFQTPNAIFNYVWNSAFNYWSGGFSYTNRYDSITPGYTNEFGIRALKGYNNSDTYVVAQDKAKIKIKAPYNTVDGFYITNTTYAYKSMKTGDSFAKKFGGATGNDNDYFGITVKAYQNGALKTDTVNFYLADFRFANNTQDYIVNTWQYVNTSSLGFVDSLQFHMFSSDTNSAGFLTPAYFAIDNFATSANPVVGVAENSANLNPDVYPNPFNSALTISLKDDASSAKAVISDLSGRVVYSETILQKETVLELTNLQTGVYFLELSTGDKKTVKKIIKN